jgi:hypothetical protein
MITVKQTAFYTAHHWEPMPSNLAHRKGIAAKAKALNLDAEGYVVVRGNEHTMPSIGFYRESEGFSLEATIAAASKGSVIYVVQTDQGGYKLLLVDNQMILSGSGFEGTLEEIIAEIEGSARLVLPSAKVYCTDPVACSAAPEWDSVDIERIIDLDSKVAIEKLRSQSNLAKPLAIAIVALLAGAGALYGWQMMHNNHGPMLSKEQQEAAAKRQMYMTQQTNLLNHFKEENSNWIVDAAKQINAKYAINGFGWNFTGAECARTSCKLIWSSIPKQNAYYAPFIKMVKLDGEDKGVSGAKLSMNNNGADINAEMKLPTPEWLNLSSGVNKLPLNKTVQDSLWDFKQVMESRYGITVEPSKMGETNLVSGAVPPGVLMVIKKGSLSATGESATQLFYFAKALDAMGFYANKLVYSPGTSSKIKQQWKVEASYVTR